MTDLPSTSRIATPGAGEAAESALLAGLPPEKMHAVRELLRERALLFERYRRLVDTTSDAIVITDPARTIVFANPAAHGLFGYSDSGLIGKPLDALAAPESRGDVDERERQAFAGVAQQYETTVVLANGEPRTVSISSAPLREGDDVTGVVATLRDVTDERRARDAVAQSEARYRNLFETASDAIYTMDVHGSFTSVNRATCLMSGYDREELLGRPAEPFLDRDDFPIVERHFREALAGEAQRYECHFFRKSGERRQLSVTNTPIVQAGQVAGVLGIARDVTAERQRDEALARSEARYTRLVETASDAIFMLDREGRFTSVNRTLELTIGRPRGELLGTRFSELLDGKQLPVAESLFRETMEGRRQRSELRYRDADGNLRTGSVMTTPVIEDGRTAGVLAIVRDVTEERRLGEELLQREKLAAIGQLVSGTAHELNNPLAGIMAFAQLLATSEPLSLEQRDAVETIQKEARRSAKIVANLLLFARQRAPQRTTTDLNAVLRDTLEMRSYVLRAEQVDVVAEFDRNLPATSADPFQLQQVVLNLLTNAEHALRTHEGKKRITLRTQRVGDRLLASVSDTGPGIPPEQLDRIFDPFFTTKVVGEGTGLGLSISHGIVRQHGGSLTVRSTPGHGATFTIDLPLVAPSRAKDAERSVDAGAQPPGHGRMLIVDDESSIRAALAVFLRRAGHQVDAVGSGREALPLLGSRRYRAILLDLRMPDMSGEAVFATLEESDPDHARRVVFTSGDTESEGTRAFLRGAGRPWIAKPFALATVADLLDSVARDDAAAAAGAAR